MGSIEKCDNTVLLMLRHWGKERYMFLYLGGDVSVKKSDIIGIFDIDDVNTQKTTKEFLRTAEKRGRMILAGDDLPKSFLLTGEKKPERSQNSAVQVILCQLSVRSVYGRVCKDRAYEKEQV